MPNDYHTQTELERTRRLRELLHELPSCCSDYFIAIEQQTSALTRLSYAYDLKLFFQYLSAELPKFGGKPIVEFTIADIQQVTKQDLERYARYLALYIKNETLDDGEINSHEMTMVLNGNMPLFVHFINTCFLMASLKATRLLLFRCPNCMNVRLFVLISTKLLEFSMSPKAVKPYRKPTRNITVSRANGMSPCCLSSLEQAFVSVNALG